MKFGHFKNVHFKKPKKSLGNTCFFWVSEHNALNSIFLLKKFVTIKNTIFAYFMAAHFVVFYAFFKTYLEIMK